MSRPTYERMEHISAEQQVANLIAEKWKCDVQKLPKFYPIDYAAVRDGDPCAWIEIKCRPVSFGSYADYIISLHKYLELLRYERETGLFSALVVCFTEGVYWHKPEPLPKVGWGGRKDRGDWQDMEPVARVDWHSFRTI